MEDNNEILLEILCDILGDPEKSYPSKNQYGFNCPECGLDEHKGNLEINIEKFVWRCWACSDVNDTHGHLGKFFDKYGTKKQKKLFNVLRPDELKPIEKKTLKLKLPEHFTLFKDSNPIYPVYKQAYNYLKSRGITNDIIEKYGIGFCDKGSHSGRIVVPSYNINGELNYYIARSWDVNSRAKYKNPQAEKDKIIFNESLINWEKDIYLVEGVFDSFFLPNSIPMLGKHMSELLFNTIYDKVKGDITIALDGDAYKDALKLYHELNGGSLYGKIKIVKLPVDKDVCDLLGKIDDYFVKIK